MGILLSLEGTFPCLGRGQPRIQTDAAGRYHGRRYGDRHLSQILSTDVYRTDSVTVVSETALLASVIAVRWFPSLTAGRAGL